VLTSAGVLLVVGFFLFMGMIEHLVLNDALGSWGKPVARYYLVLVCSVVLLSLFRFARRLRARHALTALKKDARPPMLLLRAFRDDFYRLPGYEAQLPVISIGKVTRTFEEYLHERLSACGPVIAIGRPGETACCPDTGCRPTRAGNWPPCSTPRGRSGFYGPRRAGHFSADPRRRY